MRCHVHIVIVLTYIADETSLTLFNTTSDQATTYPMLCTLGLLPKNLRRFPSNLITLALLPKYLSRKHPGASTEKHAHFKRAITWDSILLVLQELGSDDKEFGEGGTGYT